MSPDPPKENTTKLTTSARATRANGPAPVVTEVRKSKRKSKSKLTLHTHHTDLKSNPGNVEDTSRAEKNGETTDLEALYEPMPKQPKFTTVSIPPEAMRRMPQNASLTTPGPFLMSNPTPPSLPVPPFPNEETPTPPSSPSPQSAIPPTARPLWTDNAPLTTPVTAATDLRAAHPIIQRPEEPIDTALRTSPSTPDPSLPLLRTIVATSRNHAGPAATSRSTPWDPIDKYNKAPMPKIQDANPTAIFDLIDITVIDKWDTFPGERLVAIPFGNEVNFLEQHDDIRKRIFAAVAEITKSQKTAVAGPRPHEHAKPNARPPYTFIIYNLSELQRRTLLERTVWSSADITFRVALPLPTKPDFLFSITGLSTWQRTTYGRWFLAPGRRKKPLGR